MAMRGMEGMAEVAVGLGFVVFDGGMVWGIPFLSDSFHWFYRRDGVFYFISIGNRFLLSGSVEVFVKS